MNIALRRLFRQVKVMTFLHRVGLDIPVRVAWMFACRRDEVREELKLWADYWEFRRSYADLLSTGRSWNGSARRVLIVNLNSHVALTKIEGMLAKALQFAGYAPIIATFRLNTRAERYFRVFGMCQFVYLDDFFTEIDSDLNSLARDMVKENTDVASLLSVQYRGVDVGRHTVSTVLRKLRRASLDLSDPTVIQALEEGLSLSLRTVAAAEKLLDHVQPEKLIVCEKGYTPYAEFYNLSLLRSIDTLNWYFSHLSDALLFRRFTYEDRYMHAFALADETWEEVRQWPWTEEHGRMVQDYLRKSYEANMWMKRKNTLVGKRIKPPDEVRRDLGLDPEKKTAFVFSHLLWDATFWYGKNLFQDYGEWLIETIRAACANPALNWVIKLHPDNVWKVGRGYRFEGLEESVAICRQFPQLPNHVKLMLPEDDTNPISLFDVADYILTVRGTIGLEMPCFGIPVFTAGTGRYSERGFTYDSETPQEYLDKLAQLQEFPRLTPGQMALAQRYAYAVFKLRPLPIRTFEYHTGSWPYGFCVRANSKEDLPNAPDLQQFVNWAVNSSRRDFMLPSEF